MRTREAARSAPSGAGLTFRFLASAAGCRGPRPGPGRARRREAAVGESERKKKEERKRGTGADRRPRPEPGRQAGGRPCDLSSLSSPSVALTSRPEFDRPLGAQLSLRAAAESVQRARGESALAVPAPCGNDPSAGSPTETLLRLLLPLDAQV